ncbi:MAG: hypothetical protein ACOVPB_06535, partial [Bacteroidia bacterium]
MTKKYSYLFAALLGLGSFAASASNHNALPKNAFLLPKNAQPSDYEANTIVFKIDEQYRSQCANNKILIPEIQ